MGAYDMNHATATAEKSNHHTHKRHLLVARAWQFLQLMLVRFFLLLFSFVCSVKHFGVSIVVLECDYSTRNIKSLLINVINNAIAIASTHIDTCYWLVKCRYFLSPTHNGSCFFFGLVNVCAVHVQLFTMFIVQGKFCLHIVVKTK